MTSKTTLDTQIVGTWTIPTWKNTQAAHLWPWRVPSRSEMVSCVLMTRGEPSLHLQEALNAYAVGGTWHENRRVTDASLTLQMCVTILLTETRA